MATWTHAIALIDSVAGNHTTTAITPVLNDLIVVCALTVSAGVASTSSITDNQSGTYAKLVEQTGGPNAGVVSIWARTALAPASSTTYTSTVTGTTTGGGLSVYRLSGMSKTGATAARSIGGNAAAGGSAPTFNLNQAALTTNPVIAMLQTDGNPAAVTPRSSPAYTEAPTPDLGFNTPSTGWEVMFVNSGETATAITWGASSSATYAACGVELDASAAGPALSAVTSPIQAQPSVPEGLFPGLGQYW